MATEVQTYRYYPVHLERWDLEITIIRAEDGIYFPVRPLCKAFGISSQTQLQRLRAEERYQSALRDIPLPSATGAHLAACLRKPETAMWIGNINAARVKLAARGPLEEFQADLMSVADRLLFGDLSAVLRDGLISPQQLQRPTRGELYMGCPRCGAPLCLVIDESGAHLRIAPELEG